MGSTIGQHFVKNALIPEKLELLEEKESVVSRIS
jgi:hypothetical protein